jgi:hypothetical protein
MKLNIGIDLHKETNVIGLALKDMSPAIFHGKASADLNRTVDAIRNILKKIQAGEKRRSNLL